MWPAHLGVPHDATPLDDTRGEINYYPKDFEKTNLYQASLRKAKYRRPLDGKEKHTEEQQRQLARLFYKKKGGKYW